MNGSQVSWLESDAKAKVRYQIPQTVPRRETKLHEHKLLPSAPSNGFPNVLLITRGIDWENVKSASQKWVSIHVNKAPVKRREAIFTSHYSFYTLL